MERIYLDGLLEAGRGVLLDAAKAHYLTRVLRLKDGAEIGVFDGAGCEWSAILTVSGREATVVAQTCLGEDPAPRLALTLAQALPKQAKLETIWQKACELGVSGLIPLLTRHSVVKLDEGKGGRKMERWETVLEEACRQCGRRRLPLLHNPVAFDEFVTRPPVEGPIWLAYEGRDVTPLAQQLKRTPPQGRLTVVIGPEGGFSDQEVAMARDRGWPLVGLGPRILRVETAGPAVLAAIQAHCGDWLMEE